MEGELAEGVGFEPTLGFRLSLISSQVHSTTLPPFRTLIIKDLRLDNDLPRDVLQSDTFRERNRKRFRMAEDAMRKSGPLQIVRHLFRTLSRQGQAHSPESENEPPRLTHCGNG